MRKDLMKLTAVELGKKIKDKEVVSGANQSTRRDIQLFRHCG